jgi:hypothetical protein
MGILTLRAGDENTFLAEADRTTGQGMFSVAPAFEIF